MRRGVAAVAVVAGLALARPAAADVRLARIFSSDMVLQQGRKAPVWGWAEPGEEVTVAIAGQEASAVADAAGRWRVDLAPLVVGRGRTLTVRGTNTITLENVAVGEVWVCSGQSNMAMTVQPWRSFKGVLNHEQEIAAADYPDMRLFSVPRNPAEERQTDLPARKMCWRPCSPATVGMFSATAYFFGRELHKRLKMPVGLINSSVGGTPAEAWTDAEWLKRDDGLARLIAQWPEKRVRYLEKLAVYKEELKRWEAETSGAKHSGKSAPPKPARPRPNVWPCSRPGALFNGMVAPLMPLAIGGCVWNQGESNAGRAYEYRTLFPTLIRCWREQWGQGDFPFVFVQLPNVGEPGEGPRDNPRAEMREAQLLTLRSTPQTGMAVACDIGDAGDTHGRNKQDLGARLCLAALHVAYGQDLVFSGPTYRSMSVEQGRVRLQFDHVGGGLLARGGGLKHFAIAGADRKFVWAEAEIDGDSVVVRHDAIEGPAAVRYAWDANPAGANLYNREGLPASPFRTDDWPGITQRRR